MKTALIGFGQIAAKAHLPALKENGVEIVAVCEPSEPRLAAAKAALPNARFYVSPEEMLDAETEIDFVDICTPPFLHGAQVLAALKRGRHVLCEKPLVLAKEELEAIRRSATMAGKAVFTVHNWAYSPQWRKLEELLPEIGAVQHVELTVLRTKPAAGANPDDWRKQAAQAGGGILVDHGWHNLYMLYRLVGQQPGRLVARVTPPSGGVDEEAVVYFEFPTATALMHLTWKSAIRKNTYSVVGAKGTLELRDDEVALSTAAGCKHHKFDEALSAGSAHPEWLTAMLPDFFAEMSDAARRGRNLEEASFCAGAINRAYQSVRVGRNPHRPELVSRERASP